MIDDEKALLLLIPRPKLLLMMGGLEGKGELEGDVSNPKRFEHCSTCTSHGMGDCIVPC